MTPAENDGRAPIHQSLLLPRSIAGLPEQLAKMLWVTTAGFVLGARVWWVLILSVGLHAGFAWLTKVDPYFFDVARRAARGRRRLDP
ncbi:VirB3 family type IV secretion system protein [Myxococcus llanfairpwllgwyngyllgogerychwyrndrobwllllantysiliogogogochensis]|uniref:VirB3 family type IV secretion system protein n=1 Tax=Myxococcus llanfairpwllgwyngyllgogerychwyrndrobwllllantysiliogogogochensis TaxID=2590453 RepID=UPI0015F09C4E|nr:VirB3 family type IV secretion system protein [Myxococcus llanfairpwllgwyngyllgogerychwyrndrobwllllantysiliogogogochensis]